MNKAIFFDRDGVINQLALNPKTGESESPHSVEDFTMMPGAVSALKKASAAGYLLFIVSNQPSYAKGKTSLENINAIHDRLHSELESNDIKFSEYYYCYHHPEGIVPDYSGPCECRKPGQRNMEHARNKYDLDMKASWFVGDQDMDIECGKRAGTRTILVLNKLSAAKRGESSPDHFARDISEVVDIIVDER